MTNDLQAISCRAVWRVKDDDIELATKQICSKRLELDDLIASIEGVQFFVSCITAVTSNPKTSGGDRSANSNEGKVYPAIAFFIVYRESSMCNESTLFTELHKRDVDVTISSIATRSKGSASNAMEKAKNATPRPSSWESNPRPLDY